MKNKSVITFANKIENIIEKILQNKYFYYAFFVMIAIVLYYLNFKSDLKISGVNEDKFLMYFKIGSIICTIVISGLLLFNNKFKKISISCKYLIIGLILGITYVFVAPVFTQSDESFHFIRAYQISKGNFISPYDQNGNSYDEFPKSIYKVLYDDDDIFPEYKNYSDSYNESKIKLQKNHTISSDVRASNYVFLNYLPHAIGIKIGILLNFSPYTIGLLGRITNMFVCILIISISLKIIPICKKSLAILLLCPSVIAYISSLSADGLIIATALLLISYIVKFIYEKTKLNWKYYLILLLIVAFVSTCKAAYLPIIGILIFIPCDCFKNKRIKWFFTLSLVMLGIVMSLLWMNVGHISVGTADGYTGLEKYLRFGYVFINTLFNDFGAYIRNIFAGDYMYQRQVNPFQIIPISYFFVFITAIFSENTRLKMKTFNKAIIFMIIISVIALIAYALFTCNTDLNATLVNGIQGRYFVPILLLVPFFLPKKKFETSECDLINISLIINLFVLLNMVSVFAM